MGKIDRTGEERLNNDGLLMRIINYNKYNDIDILFLESGYIAKHKSYGKFKINSMFRRHVCKKDFDNINWNELPYYIVNKLNEIREGLNE